MITVATACAIQDRLDLVDIDTRDVDELLKRPDSFANWGGEEGLFVTWAIGPIIETRDSGIVEKSNAAMLKKRLEEYGEEWEEEWYIKGASHFLCGWVDHLTFRARDDSGGPTPICLFLKMWFDSLSDYPVASDDDVSEREMEALIDAISQQITSLVADGQDWDSWAIVNWWDENNMSYETEDSEGTGAWPSEEGIEAACRGLGYKMEEDE